MERNLSKNRVITYGTFDLFHYGHLLLLERAKKYGDELYVGLSSDEFNAMKNKEVIYPYEVRKHMLSALNCVNYIFEEDNWDQKISDIKKYHIGTFIMGNDWQGKFDFLKDYCQVVYLPRTENISTTLLKQGSMTRF